MASLETDYKFSLKRYALSIKRIMAAGAFGRVYELRARQRLYGEQEEACSHQSSFC